MVVTESRRRARGRDARELWPDASDVEALRTVADSGAVFVTAVDGMPDEPGATVAVVAGRRDRRAWPSASGALSRSASGGRPASGSAGSRVVPASALVALVALVPLAALAVGLI